MALHYLRCALDGGEGNAWTDIGVLFKNGWGVKKDGKEAITCFRKGMQVADPRAHRCMGDSYRYGLGDIEKDEKQAIFCYKQAIEGGDCTAYTSLGWVYYYSPGNREKNNMKALHNFQLAVKYGDVKGHTGIGLLCLGRKGIGKDLQEAIENFEKAAAVDDPIALFNLGRLHYWGEGVPKDFGKAMEYFKKEEAAGYTPTYARLGNAHCEKITDNSDDTISISKQGHAAIAQYWYRQSERFGNDESGKIKSLQEKYPSLKNTADEAKFNTWWALAKTDDAEGNYQFGLLYQEGAYLEQNDGIALQCFQRAADKNHVLACVAMGNHYHDSYLSQNYSSRDYRLLDSAKQYYKKAADQGNAEGCYKYAMISFGEERVKYLEMASENGYEKAAFELKKHEMVSLDLIKYHEENVKPSQMTAEEINEKLAEYMATKGVDGKLTAAGSQNIQWVNNNINNTKPSIFDEALTVISTWIDNKNVEKDDGNAEKVFENI